MKCPESPGIPPWLGSGVNGMLHPLSGGVHPRSRGTAVGRLLDLLEEVTWATLTDEQRARVLGPGQDG